MEQTSILTTIGEKVCIGLAALALVYGIYLLTWAVRTMIRRRAYRISPTQDVVSCSSSNMRRPAESTTIDTRHPLISQNLQYRDDGTLIVFDDIDQRPIIMHPRHAEAYRRLGYGNVEPEQEQMSRTNNELNRIMLEQARELASQPTPSTKWKSVYTGLDFASPILESYSPGVYVDERSDWEIMVDSVRDAGKRSIKFAKEKQTKIDLAIAGIPVTGMVSELGFLDIDRSVDIRIPVNDLSPARICISIFSVDTLPKWTGLFDIFDLSNFVVNEDYESKDSVSFLDITFTGSDYILHSSELSTLFTKLGLDLVRKRQFGLGQRRVSFASPQNDKTQTQGGTG
jgi:hypothetical protein